MTMRNWIEKLDEFLKISGRKLLDHAGKISAETARAKAVRGIVLKNEQLPLSDWITGLARDLSAEAATSEQARIALERLLT